MRKLLFVCLAVFVFALSSCSPDYSYSDTEFSRDENNNTDFNLLETKFVSGYYRSIGEIGLNQLSENSPVTCLRGQNGLLLYANTPTRMIFNYATDRYVWSLMEYDKLTGDFSYACHDILCTHDSCLFSQGKKVFSGTNHLFFISDHGGECYISDPDGSNVVKLPIPEDAELYSDTDKGLFWGKTELVDQRVLYSLWFYDYSSGKSEQLAEPLENVIYYVVGDKVYLHDMVTLTLYGFSADFSRKTEIADDVTYLSNFGGSLYDYNYNTGVLQKLQGNKMVTVAKLSSVGDYWVSAGYIYYCRADLSQIESYKDDDEMYEYLSRYNQTCGNVYRIKEFGDTPELVYHGSHDGKPDLIDNIFADGEVLYIQYRDYNGFPNNFSKERGNKNLVIFDVTTGESIDITN